jgi:hypothetical protein
MSSQHLIHRDALDAQVGKLTAPGNGQIDQSSEGRKLWVPASSKVASLEARP